MPNMCELRGGRGCGTRRNCGLRKGDMKCSNYVTPAVVASTMPEGMDADTTISTPDIPATPTPTPTPTPSVPPIIDIGVTLPGLPPIVIKL